MLSKFIKLTDTQINISWGLFDKAYRLAVTLVIGVFTTRYLGPTNFGLLNYASIIPSFFVPVATLGISSTLLIELLRGEFSEKSLIGSSMVLRFISGIIVLSLVIAYSYIYLHEYLVLIICFGFNLIFQASNTIEIYFQAKLDVRKSVIAKSIAFTLTSVFKIYLLITKEKLIYFALASLLDFFLTALILHIFFELENSIFKLEFNKNVCRHLLKISLPIIISELLIIVYMKIDQLMLNSMVGVSELGKYSAAIRLSESWYFLASIITNSYFPSIVNKAKDSNIDVNNGFFRLFKILGFVSIALGIVVTLIGVPLCSFIYGERFEGVGTILIIHIWSSVFVFLGVAGNAWLMHFKYQKKIMVNTFCGAIVNIFLNLCLIPVFSGVGAAISTLVAYFLAGVLMNVFYKETRKLFFLQANAVKNILLLKINDDNEYV